MKTYADTGFLCSLYAPDAHTTFATGRMATQEASLPLIWLHQIELRNALRLRVFRGEITQQQRDSSLNAFVSDIRDGVYRHVSVHEADLLLECERLSALHTESLGVRSLDIIHVAAAIAIGAEVLFSFDTRQCRLARAAGLRVPDLRERRPSTPDADQG